MGEDPNHTTARKLSSGEPDNDFCDLFRMISLVLLSTSLWPTIILKFISPVKNPSHMKPIKRVVGWEGCGDEEFCLC